MPPSTSDTTANSRLRAWRARQSSVSMVPISTPSWSAICWYVHPEPSRMASTWRWRVDRRSQRTVDQLAVDGGEDELLGSVLTDHADGTPRSELHVVGRRAARAAAQHVGADVPGDDGAARGRSAARRRTVAAPSRHGQTPPAPRPRPRGDHCSRRMAEPEQPLVVARVEVAERSRVPRPGSATTSARSRSRSTSSQRLVSSSWRSATSRPSPSLGASLQEVIHIMSAI